MPSNIIAACFALAAYASAIVVGIAAENDAIQILTRALFAMLICYGVGMGVGMMGEYAIRENVEDYKKSHPIHPHDDDPGDESVATAEGEQAEAA